MKFTVDYLKGESEMKNLGQTKNPKFNNGFFNWMGMNEINPTYMSKEFIKYPSSNMESCFFPELGLLYNAYKSKPWFISTKLLLLNTSMVISNIDENIDKKEEKSGVLVQLKNLVKSVMGLRVMKTVKDGKLSLIFISIENQIFLLRTY